MQEWRWDQGRILYFQFDVLKEVARVLCKFDGKNVNDNQIAQNFKHSLIESVGLPFSAPNNYKVIRNYSRVFQCSLLAKTRDGGELFVSDICRQLASEAGVFEAADDYFIEVINRFRFPFPAFQQYNADDAIVYPFIAIIKYLTSQKLMGNEGCLSVNDVASLIVGNNCTGLEDIDFYKSLTPTSYTFMPSTQRQVREMLAFVGQASFLKVFNKKIYLDVYGEEEINNIINNVLHPFAHKPVEDRFEEFTALTKLQPTIVLHSDKLDHSQTPSFSRLDIEFTEGKRKRVNHFRIERSPLLRKAYIRLHPEPICNACEMHIKEKYPWVDYMLDLHHLLPLSSSVRIGNSGNTTLDDMVGLCPSCHKAIHLYYKKWLKSHSRDDFRNKKEAMQVYLDAIREII